MQAELVLLILRKSRLKFLVSFDFRFLQYLFPLVVTHSEKSGGMVCGLSLCF